MPSDDMPSALACSQMSLNPAPHSSFPAVYFVNSPSPRQGAESPSKDSQTEDTLSFFFLSFFFFFDVDHF